MSRKRREAERSNHERWLVSYADFITLLFAFFVVLFASSQVDKRKVGRIALAIQDAFQEMGIFQNPNPRVALVTTAHVPAEDTQVIESAKDAPGLGKTGSPDDLTGIPHAPADLSIIEKQLQAALAPQLERREVAMKLSREGLVISLREGGFFDSGSAEVRQSSQAAVASIAHVLLAQSNNIRIEGHTDNVPIHNPQFASNWELSTTRATEMIRLFLTQYNFPATRLSAAGYAEYHPAATNSTEEGRAQNRRVDIVVLGPAPYLDKLVTTAHP